MHTCPYANSVYKHSSTLITGKIASPNVKRFRPRGLFSSRRANQKCSKWQAQARQCWLTARERELLDTSYFPVVFTVPHELNVLALENPRLFYDLLFTASAQTLLEIASDLKHVGAECHPAGGFSLDHRRWIPLLYPFFLPVKVLSRVFRGKFLAGLKRLHRRDQLQCAGPAAALADHKQFAKLLRRPIATRDLNHLGLSQRVAVARRC